jgi:hypothetical protein
VSGFVDSLGGDGKSTGPGNNTLLLPVCHQPILACVVVSVSH